MITRIIKELKSNRIQLPIWLGQAIANIPYSSRPIVGKIYKERLQEIYFYEHCSIEQKRAFIFSRMRTIVEYAIQNIPFYRKYYADQNFSLEDLKCYEDIVRIPIIDKHILLKYSLQERSNESESRFLVNTGGSSGYTLTFYVQPSSIGNEWAHIHTMWGKIGFTPSDLKLCIAGRNVVKNGVDYEFARHTLSLDMYRPYEETAFRLKKILRKYPCYYLHGYPSVLSEFAEYCKTDIELLDLLKRKLRGAFLSSEYPYPMYRDPIEQIFGIPTQSFYGHTERCVMAYETKQKFNFKPFQTYGFTEAISNGDNHYDLIGTSYYNFASPLIRYNTKDIIDNPVYENDILSGFNIFEGRSGQFILDNFGKRISLTGLVMGRHHKIFDYCSHIQIEQKEKGSAIIYYVPKEKVVLQNPEQMFDSSNVDIMFTFKKINEPIRTISGKVNLLVKDVDNTVKY